MADRTVSVKIALNTSGFMQGMGEVAKQTSETGTKIEKLAQQRESFNTLGVAALGFGAALGAGVAIAVSKFAEFDQQMSYVEAATHETASNMDLLKDAALDAGASTVFSATEAAQAIEELSKAGIQTADILSGALKGSMDLAAAGGLSVARAAEITSTALNQFELDGSDASHVADLLAAGAGKAMGSVDDLAQGLKFVGPVANAMGVSLEETTGVMALFAQQGIIGEQAGTSLRGVLASLTSPSAQARKEIERLGITLYDSEGNFMGLQNAAGELSQAYTTMDGASRDASLGIIFGRETVTAATALYKAGADGVQQWTEAVDDSGYAFETARQRVDNLKGDWEALSGAMDTAFITMGEGADGPLRYLVQNVTDAVDAFNGLPDWAQQSALAIGAAAGAAALMGGTALVAIPKIADFRDSLVAVGVDGDRVVGKLGKFAKIGGGFVVGFAAAAAGLDLLTQAMQNMGDASEVTDNKLISASNAAEVLSAALGKGFGSTADMKVAQSAVEGLAEMLDLAATGAQATGESIRPVLNAANAVMKLGDELGELAASNLPAAQEKFRLLAEEGGLTEDQMVTLLNKMDPFKKALTEQASAAGVAADDQTLLNLAIGEGEGVAQSTADAYLEQAGAVGDLQSQFEELIATIDEANGRNRDAITANIDYQETLRSVDEQIANIRNGVEGYAAGLDVSTKAGSDNMAMLVQMSEDAWNAAAAQLQLDGDTAAFTATLEAQRQKLFDAAKGFAASDEEAGHLRDTLLAYPPDRTIKVLADTSSANANLNSLLGRLNEAVRTHFNIPVSTVGVGTVLKPPGSAAGDFFSHSPTGFAAGGFPSGIYSGTAGSIHKFAEPWLPWESYISGDPGRRDRNVGIWEKTGEKLGVWQQGGTTPILPAPTPNGPVAVSLAGAQFTMLVDGRQVTAIVQEQIVQAQQATFAPFSGGRR